MDFFRENLDLILRATAIGCLFGWCFAKINNLKDYFLRFKDCSFKFVSDDVERLKTQSYQKVDREDLVREVNYLTQRILVIETQMEEREKAKERS